MGNQVAQAEQSREVAQRSENGVTPMEMLQIAVERGADMDQLTKLMDLQERWEANQARKAFVEALNAFKADPPKITKNKHVSFRTNKGVTEYDHATLDQVAERVGTALAEHGLSHRWKVDQEDNNAIRVTCVLTHRLGHSEEVTMRAMPDDSGNKNSIQQVGSTVTYLQRYTLLAATGLATAENDDDATTGGTEMITADEKQQLIDLIKLKQADTAKFCQFMGVSALDEIPRNRFPAAYAALVRKPAPQKEGSAK